MQYNCVMGESRKTAKGQVLCYVHDPDELVITAESFDAYLQMLIEEEYDFITEENIEVWE